jgi:hypothetical protein
MDFMIVMMLSAFFGTIGALFLVGVFFACIMDD